MDVNKIGNGAIFEGTKGTILADFTTRVIIPNNDDGDFTYYKRRGEGPTAAADRRNGTADAGSAAPGARAGRRAHGSRVRRCRRA